MYLKLNRIKKSWMSSNPSYVDVPMLGVHTKGSTNHTLMHYSHSSQLLGDEYGKGLSKVASSHFTYYRGKAPIKAPAIRGSNLGSHTGLYNANRGLKVMAEPTLSQRQKADGAPLSFNLDRKVWDLNLKEYKTMEYSLETFNRSNQDTCLVHRPAVFEGQWVQSGDLLADCASSVGGELALGQNLLIAYMPWEGYNYEDAILISERLVYDDLYTSVHIEKYEIETRETKLGNEEITRNVPDVSPHELNNLDKNGIVKVGSWVEEGDILVGKVTPIPKKIQSPYQKLVYTILEKDFLTVRDSSLRAPKGIRAKIIKIQLFKNKKTTTLTKPKRKGTPSTLKKVSQNKPPKTKSVPILTTSKLSPVGGKNSKSNLTAIPLRGMSMAGALPLPLKKMKNYFKSMGLSKVAPSHFYRGSTPGHTDAFKRRALKGKKHFLIKTNSFFLLSTKKGKKINTNLTNMTDKNKQSLGLLSCIDSLLFSYKSKGSSPTYAFPNEREIKDWALPTLKPSQSLIGKGKALKGKSKNLSKPISSVLNNKLGKGTKLVKKVNTAHKPLKGVLKEKVKKSLFSSGLQIHLYLAEKRKVQVGDKLAGRHGNKGIISMILPREDMPYLPDGTPIDMVLNPLGVPSRMNVGQIYECLLGFAGKFLGENYKVFPFDEIYGPEASRSFVYSKLNQARLKTGSNWIFNPTTPGKLRLYDGRTGDCFDQAITVGQAYILRLVHMVDDKIHARSTGPYSLVTQQPLRGRSKQGGQRLGEMEVWALEGYGAAFTLLEMLTIKSDDMTGRMTLWSNLILNSEISIGTPESFKVLICELQALCLDIGLFRFNNTNLSSSNKTSYILAPVENLMNLK